MTTKPFIYLTFILAFAFVSCSKVMPSGFWNDYQKEFLIKNNSDQGPSGGHTAIYWKANKPNYFTSGDVLEFAIKNGWTIVDSAAYNSDQTNSWTYNNKPVFPLSSIGFSGIPKNDAETEYFPRWFGGPLRVYKFKTNWMTIEPGTNNSMNENGFVLISSDGAEMAVYHLWGE